MEMVQKESSQINDVRRTGSTSVFRNRSRYQLSRSGALCPGKPVQYTPRSRTPPPGSGSRVWRSICGRARFIRYEPLFASHDVRRVGLAFPPGRPFSAAVTGTVRQPDAARSKPGRLWRGGRRQQGALPARAAGRARAGGLDPAAWSRRRGPGEAAGAVRPGLSRAEGKFLPPGQRQEKSGPRRFPAECSRSPFSSAGWQTSESFLPALKSRLLCSNAEGAHEESLVLPLEKSCKTVTIPGFALWCFMALKYDFLVSQLWEITMPLVLIRKFISRRVMLVSQVSLVLSSKVCVLIQEKKNKPDKRKHVTVQAKQVPLCQVTTAAGFPAAPRRVGRRDLFAPSRRRTVGSVLPSAPSPSWGHQLPRVTSTRRPQQRRKRTQNITQSPTGAKFIRLN
ncbi:uncharacterized protein ACIBXB_000317 [Morphnus guianensis]